MMVVVSSDGAIKATSDSVGPRRLEQKKIRVGV